MCQWHTLCAAFGNKTNHFTLLHEARVPPRAVSNLETHGNCEQQIQLQLSLKLRLSSVHVFFTGYFVCTNEQNSLMFKAFSIFVANNTIRIIFSCMSTWKCLHMYIRTNTHTVIHSNACAPTCVYIHMYTDSYIPNTSLNISLIAFGCN